MHAYRHAGITMTIYLSERVLEEFGDLISAALRPRPRLRLVVERRRHDVIRCFGHLGAVAFVVVPQTEPARATNILSVRDHAVTSRRRQ